MCVSLSFGGRENDLEKNEKFRKLWHFRLTKLEYGIAAATIVEMNPGEEILWTTLQLCEATTQTATIENTRNYAHQRTNVVIVVPGICVRTQKLPPLRLVCEWTRCKRQRYRRSSSGRAGYKDKSKHTSNECRENGHKIERERLRHRRKRKFGAARRIPHRNASERFEICNCRKNEAMLLCRSAITRARTSNHTFIWHFYVKAAEWPCHLLWQLWPLSTTQSNYTSDLLSIFLFSFGM